MGAALRLKREMRVALYDVICFHSLGAHAAAAQTHIE
jgi:hypothetical protein